MRALKRGTWGKATPVYSLCSSRISRVAASLASDSDAPSPGVTVLCTVLPRLPFRAGADKLKVAKSNSYLGAQGFQRRS
jgi:hypothetical protein